MRPGEDHSPELRIPGTSHAAVRTWSLNPVFKSSSKAYNGPLYLPTGQEIKTPPAWPQVKPSCAALTPDTRTQTAVPAPHPRGTHPGHGPRLQPC